MSSDYSKKYINELVASAKALTPDIDPKRIKVNHVTPRALCVAKTAPLCAVFSVPPCDSEPQVCDRRFVEVHWLHTTESCTVRPRASLPDALLLETRVGDWCALAYVYTPDGTGANVIVSNLDRSIGEATVTTYKQGGTK